jgi:hypothetical protein
MSRLPYVDIDGYGAPSRMARPWGISTTDRAKHPCFAGFNRSANDRWPALPCRKTPSTVFGIRFAYSALDALITKAIPQTLRVNPDDLGAHIGARIP